RLLHRPALVRRLREASGPSLPHAQSRGGSAHPPIARRRGHDSVVRHRRPDYRGDICMNRLEAVIFDWAGTTGDHGSLAPLRAITEVFSRYDIALRDEEARRDMGIYKKDHIRRILQLPQVQSQWSSLHGAAPSEADVDRLFTHFIPLQMETLAAH